MDVKTAFLNGTLEADIYMAQPAGCVKEGAEEKVCNFRKSLYGLKQSARCWKMEIDRFLKDSEYKQSNADSCIYTKVVSSNGNQVSFLILSLYVDYILIASNDTQLLVKEKQMLSQRFEDMGPAMQCLGMLIERSRKNRTLFVRHI